jgi:GST-like protein
VDLDLSTNAQLDPAYTAINPTGKIPALRLPSGAVVTESAAILVTIADRHPEAQLLPRAGSDQRAEALRWIAFCASEIYPIVEIVDYPERFSSAGERAEALRDSARQRLRARALILEQNISGQPWILATGFSVADLYAANLTRWDVGRDWREANCPKLDAIATAIGMRDKAGPVWRRHFGDGA